MGVAAIVLAAVIGFVVVFGVVFSLFARAAQRKEAEARGEFPSAQRIDARALFFGQESRGAMQMRGNGTLVLTGSQLVFRQWVVDREFRVPCSAISAVETPRSFLGKSQGVKLLCVRYRGEAGADDAMAWRVPDLDGWLSAIAEARRTREPSASGAGG